MSSTATPTATHSSRRHNMGVILQTSESLKKISIKMDFLTEAVLRVKENDVAIEYRDFVKGMGLFLEDVAVELASLNDALDKVSVRDA